MKTVLASLILSVGVVEAAVFSIAHQGDIHADMMQMKCFCNGTVAAAENNDFFPLKKRAVTGTAITDAMP